MHFLVLYLLPAQDGVSGGRPAVVPTCMREAQEALMPEAVWVADEGETLEDHSVENEEPQPVNVFQYIQAECR